MTVFEKGTYLTVGDLKAKLAEIDDDSVPVCGIYDGRQPLVNVIWSCGDYDKLVVLALQLASPDDVVEVDFN